ncbi:MAG: TetR/AcrR family transcriptional regulator [Methanothrix sp.]|nr:TetR/AcrR family transcriptional regulator [Methanothrix sp.]
MGISERKMREKDKRKKEILDTAERLFFSRGYDDVSMDEIANEVELNKATLYLYFKNKETLFAAIVLRGIWILQKKYVECMETQVPGVVKVALMGQAYYRFSQEHPDYLRLIHFYGSERFSKENPCTAEIGKGYGTCRMILRDAVQEGIDDGTIRDDLNPFLISMYLMTTFMGILSMEDKWKRVIEAEGFSYEQYSREFFRFILPAIKSGASRENPHLINVKGFESFDFFQDPIEIETPKRKKEIIGRMGEYP